MILVLSSGTYYILTSPSRQPNPSQRRRPIASAHIKLFAFNPNCQLGPPRSGVARGMPAASRSCSAFSHSCTNCHTWPSWYFSTRHQSRSFMLNSSPNCQYKKFNLTIAGSLRTIQSPSSAIFPCNSTTCLHCVHFSRPLRCRSYSAHAACTLRVHNQQGNLCPRCSAHSLWYRLSWASCAFLVVPTGTLHFGHAIWSSPGACMTLSLYGCSGPGRVGWISIATSVKGGGGCG
ncbi:hypothetical protein EXIGLDRAFT_234478 [Exidia glandulosa HHB12029]|uniref:Uncharacterized protein n=1 Tax=Exidia glandulosa HHB12029 TaxID=1314781 RepID=A0A165MKD0_EXIGL|nr:hypothetical protein EXIGLDRAFT_234478 [Exidia glandulosa HHB12029]